MRVGHMPLRALDFEKDVHRAAPADLHHVTQAVDRSRLPHETEVRNLAPRAHAVDQCARAMNRRPLLVAGDDEAYRAGVGSHALQRRNHRSDRPFHVDSAAPVEQVAARLRAALGIERLAGPSSPGRHHVEVACKSEVARTHRAVADREQVFDRFLGRLTGHETVYFEAEGRQHFFQGIEHRPTRRRYALAGDQPFGEVDRVHGLRRPRTARSPIARLRRPGSTPASRDAPRQPACRPARSPALRRRTS